MCPTLQRLLEAERDQWYGATRNTPLDKGPSWEECSMKLTALLGKSDLENYLLNEVEDE